MPIGDGFPNAFHNEATRSAALILTLTFGTVLSRQVLHAMNTTVYQEVKFIRRYTYGFKFNASRETLSYRKYS